MEAEQFDFSVVFPNIAAQLRSVLGNLHLAAAQLAPAIRQEDPALDSTASLLDQSYYRLLRLVNNLTAAGELGQDAPLPVRDRDLTETVRAVCAGAQGLFALKRSSWNSGALRTATPALFTSPPSSCCSTSCSPMP